MSETELQLIFLNFTTQYFLKFKSKVFVITVYDFTTLIAYVNNITERCGTFKEIMIIEETFYVHTFFPQGKYLFYTIAII